MNSPNTDPELKIRMIKQSLRCFTFGLMGLIPVIGLPFAISALVAGGSARGLEVRCWSAARPFRRWGVAIAACSVIFWSGVLIIFVFEATQPNG